MIRTEKTEAFVLKRKHLLNRDLLITLFTKEHGKINVFAKGVKKITSKRAAHLQTANLINAILHKKSDRWYLQETDLISGFIKIRLLQKKIRFIQFFLFLLDRLLPEEQKEPKIFSLIQLFLIDLSKNNRFDDNSLLSYSSNLLFLLGYIEKSQATYSELLLTIESIIDEKPPSFQI